MVAQDSSPSLSDFLEDVFSLSGNNGGYVIVSFIFQSTEKWPEMKPDGTRELAC